jgi:ribosomal protein S18 acetylase RimI-like enzyme
MAAGLSEVRVAGPPGAPLGFCMLKGDELYQIYVAAEARGSDVAAALLADGEARLAARGVPVAWLACAIGNHRAARFYEKSGWQRIGIWTDPPRDLGGNALPRGVALREGSTAFALRRPPFALSGAPRFDSARGLATLGAKG